MGGDGAQLSMELGSVEASRVGPSPTTAAMRSPLNPPRSVPYMLQSPNHRDPPRARLESRSAFSGEGGGMIARATRGWTRSASMVETEKTFQRPRWELHRLTPLT